MERGRGGIDPTGILNLHGHRGVRVAMGLHPS
jgi:hypothetical protein